MIDLGIQLVGHEASEPPVPFRFDLGIQMLGHTPRGSAIVLFRDLCFLTVAPDGKLEARDPCANHARSLPAFSLLNLKRKNDTE